MRIYTCIWLYTISRNRRVPNHCLSFLLLGMFMKFKILYNYI